MALALSPEQRWGILLGGTSRSGRPLLRQQNMLDPIEIELSAATDMDPVEFDHNVPGWLLFGLGALTVALGLLLYFSY